MTPRQAEFDVFRSERFVFSVVLAGVRRKIIQIIFPRDGSVFVSFPYYEHTDGLINVARLWPGEDEVSLIEPGGKITSHLVKYSHHPDGNVHFSQDRKILTRVRKRAVPLDDVNGQLFTVKVQGLDAFAEARPSEYEAQPSTKRTNLNFSFGQQTPEAVSIDGWMQTRDQLAAGLESGPIGPTIIAGGTTPDEPDRPAFVISAPEGHAGDGRYLVMKCWEIPALMASEPTTLTFAGGWDPPQPPGAPFRFLTLAYPIMDEEEVRTRIGTVDLPSDGTTPPAKPPGRNDPCWCGSGKKYKKCHGR